MDSIVTLGIISLLVMISPALSTLTKLPIVVVEILLGSIALYFGVFSHLASLEFIAHIGFLFLMFLCGLEVDLKTFKGLGIGFFKAAGIYFLGLYCCCLLVVWYIGFSSFYLAALPVMSLGMIMALLKEYPKRPKWLNLALNVGILGELISITILVVMNGAYSYGLTWELYRALFVLFIFLLGLVWFLKLVDILFWWFPSLRFVVMPKDSQKNQDIRFSAMLFLSMIGISHLLGIESVIGAFMAGVILATYFQYHHQLVEKLNDIGFGFFIPIFFVYVGSTLDLRLIVNNFDLLKQTLLIIGIMVSLRAIAAFVAYRAYLKHPINIALFALSHSMPLTFLVATAQLGKQFNAISMEEYYAFILAAVIEGIGLSVLIKFLANYKHKIIRPL